MKKLLQVFLIILFCACHKQSDTTDNPSNPDTNDTVVIREPIYLWPLKQDNQWNYRSVVYQPNGIDTASVADDFIKVNGPFMINDHLYFTYPDSHKGADNVIRNIDTTAVEMGNLTGPIQLFYKKVKDPYEVLHEKTEGTPMGDMLTYKTIAYPGTTTVDSFQNCIRTDEITLYIGDTIHREVFYLKPGIGFVQSTTYGKMLGAKDLHPISRKQLLSYILK